MQPEHATSGPFATLYEEWYGGDPERDQAMEQRLAESYRGAWAAGDANERVHVLYFLEDMKDVSSIDLLLEGLKSHDHHLAKHAAVQASVWSGRQDVDFGEGIAEIWRDLLSRFPDLDVLRWPTLRRANACIDWPQGREFIRLYDSWAEQDFPREDALEQQLLGAYRAVWTTGDDLDRAFVLNFIGYGHEDEAPDLIVEGLKSSDEGLAHTALFAAGGAIREGVDLGPDIRQLIHEYTEHFPDNWVSAKGALMDLDKYEGRASD